MTEPGAARVLKFDDLAAAPGKTARFEGHVVVPPETPHRFTAGPDGLRSVNIHGNDRMIQENLSDDG